MKQVVSGTYHRELITATGVTDAAGTERELTTLANIVKADSKDELFSWIRYVVYRWSSADPICYEWAVIRCQQSDATQDLNADATVEGLQRMGRILKRGIIWDLPVAGSGPRPIKFELFNVKLDVGEELRILLCPWVSTAGATVSEKGLLEYRQVGN